MDGCFAHAHHAHHDAHLGVVAHSPIRPHGCFAPFAHDAHLDGRPPRALVAAAHLSQPRTWMDAHHAHLSQPRTYRVAQADENFPANFIALPRLLFCCLAAVFSLGSSAPHSSFLLSRCPLSRCACAGFSAFQLCRNAESYQFP